MIDNLPLHGNAPPRLLTFWLTRVLPLREAPFVEALAELAPDLGPRARLVVLADAIEMVTDAVRRGLPSAVLSYRAELPPDSDTAWWATVGIAVLIELRSGPETPRRVSDPLLAV